MQETYLRTNKEFKKYLKSQEFRPKGEPVADVKNFNPFRDEHKAKQKRRAEAKRKQRLNPRRRALDSERCKLYYRKNRRVRRMQIKIWTLKNKDKWRGSYDRYYQKHKDKEIDMSIARFKILRRSGFMKIKYRLAKSGIRAPLNFHASVTGNFYLKKGKYIWSMAHP